MSPRLKFGHPLPLAVHLSGQGDNVTISKSYINLVLPHGFRFNGIIISFLNVTF